MRDILADLATKLHAEQRGGRWHADCPFCGKEAKRGQTHFSITPHGYYCFVCGAKGSHNKLAGILFGDHAPVYEMQPRRPLPPKAPPTWQSDAIGLLRTYSNHPDNVTRWQAYKPLRIDIINRWHFGFGALPGQSHDRLIVPIIVGGEVVALRGRAIDGREPKWISATGSTMKIWNLDGIGAGATVWIMENYVDAALFMQENADWQAVAVGGARALRDDEVATIAAAQPGRVIVAYDNDLAGQATGAMYSQLRQEWADAWRARNPGKTKLPPAPEPSGPKVVNQLRQAGVNALLFRWPESAPAKADVGWAVMTA